MSVHNGALTSSEDHESGGHTLQLVLFSLLPAALVLSYQFGFGIIINVVIAATTAVLSEALALKLRNRPVTILLSDYSALLTGVLLGLSLPPLVPWWLVLIASLFSIIVAKQLFGGSGTNPFNPAMVGYVVALLSFPLEMSTWVKPISLLSDGIHHPSLTDSMSIVFSSVNIPDGVTGATPLDIFKHSSGLVADQIYQITPAFGTASFAGVGWEWTSIAFLCGGLILLKARVFSWHAPVAMLSSLAILSVFFWDSGSSNSAGSPIMHLFSGATMMGAFFIITDPGSSAKTKRGKLVYGALIGFLIFTIRVWGDYPDAIAFAVLLGNFAVPLIDILTHDIASTKIEPKNVD